MPLLQLRNGALAFGHVPLLDNVELLIEARERVCLIGRNGTGKSSLLNVLTREQPLDSGTLWVEDGVQIAKLAQEVPAGATQTLYDTVARGLGPISELLSRYHALSEEVGNGDPRVLDEMSQTQAEIDQLGAWDASQKVDAMLSRLQLPAHALMAQCSGGIRRRAMLAQAMVSEPDLLLLDEPTNHLDIESIDGLQTAVQNFPGAVVFVTHDRTFIDDIATRIIELDRGQLVSFPGSYRAYQKRKEAMLAAEAEQDRKFDRVLGEEEVWIRQGIKARRTRNEGRVRRLEAMRGERRERIARQGKVKLALDSSGQSGKLVVEADDVSFSYADTASGSESVIIRDFSTLILRGDRVGIIGPNGSGKSTLLQLLLARLEPSLGTVRRGTQLEIAYFDQERLQLRPDVSVRDNVAQGADQIEIGGKTKHVMSYLRDFLFPPQRANSPVSALSGGERNRLLLAKLFAKPANLLVLDEPTNDLDVETLELLEELLADFSGTLLLVSHDRAFLDKTVTSTLVIEQDGRVAEYVGGYSDWLRQRPQPSAQPATVSASSKSKSESNSVAKNQKKTAKANVRRLSYKEERELQELPAQIEALERKQEALSEVTSGKDFYQQPSADVEATLKSLADLGAELEQCYERWAELEEKKEAAS